MKRTWVLLVGSLLLGAGLKAAEPSPAVVERMDGRALRVFLKGLSNDVLTVRLDKALSDSQMQLADVRSIQFSFLGYDENAVQQAFDQADYKQVITVLGPVTAPYLNYVAITNNLESAFCLLMRACVRSGNYAQARQISSLLMESQNLSVKLPSQVCRSLSALGEGDIATAEAVLKNIPDAAAALYVRACIQQAEKQPKTAIQTVVKLIAEYPNDRDWLPPAELLSASLYLQMGMTNSAIAVARQAQKFYEGTNVGKEAEALRSEIEKSAVKPE